MPDKDFKVMVINILTGLEKRVRISKKSSTKRKYKKEQSEMKKSITETKNTLEWGTWWHSQLKRLALDFSSDHDLRVLGLSPTVGSTLSRESLRILSPFAPPPTHACALSFKCINLKKKYTRGNK